MYWILIYTLYTLHVKDSQEGQHTAGLLLAIIFSGINELVSKQIVVLCWWGVAKVKKKTFNFFKSGFIM